MPLALVVSFALAGLALVFALHRRAARIDRQLHEDLLKRFYQCEGQDREPQLEGLAGMLDVPLRHARTALEHLVRDGLIGADGPRLRLTRSGREAARQLVRRHRLIETYLAERGGLAPEALHRHADRMEHALPRERIEAIDRSLGHPLRDPHGDPIPGGPHRCQGRPTVSLGSRPPGTIVEVAHVEDEPEELYRELLEHGVILGATLEITANDAAGLRVAIAGHGEANLGPPLAGQVDVVPSETGAEELRALLRLSDLPLGTLARVVMLTSDLHGEGRRRLLDLGLTRGATVRPLFENAFGNDPTAYLIRQSKIALRKDQARHVVVVPLEGPEATAEGATA
jgi:DtxR family transcriptional regulator, Mn-dependent transcriptional regulator